MPSQFSEAAPGGTVSGTRTVRRRSRGLIVEYVLEWTGEEPVTVLLTDRVPTADVEQYGFHEDHAPPEWSITDGELDLEADLEPGSERRLVLGLIAADGATDTFDQAEPVVDGIERGSDAEPDDADHAAADGPDVDLAVDLEDPGPGAEAQEQEVTGPASGEATQGRRVDADGGTVNRDPDPDGSVVSELVAELEAGTVPESELSTLRDHLDDGSESEAVRLEYVQKRLSDFDAYVDALEDLISVHGSGDDAITDLDERLADLADEVAAVRQRQDEMADRLEALSGSLDDHAEALESHQVTHEADVDDLRTEIRRRGEVLCEEFNDLQQSLDEDLAALEAEIEAFESIRRTLVDGLQRPDDLRAGTTLEDADPGALEETEAIPIVDPGEVGDDETDGNDAAVELEAAAADPALESGGSGDGADDVDTPSVGGSEVSVDLEESLERAEASNYSGSADAPEDHAGRAESGADRDEDGRSDDEFVHPASDDPGDVTDEESDSGSPESTDGESGNDAGDEAGEEFVVPGADIDDSDAVDERAAVEDAEAEDAETDDAETDDAETDDDVPGVDGDRDDADDHDADADDSDGRATSIFEIGDVGSNGSGDEEKPTIDFEDP